MSHLQNINNVTVFRTNDENEIVKQSNSFFKYRPSGDKSIWDLIFLKSIKYDNTFHSERLSYMLRCNPVAKIKLLLQAKSSPLIFENTRRECFESDHLEIEHFYLQCYRQNQFKIHFYFYINDWNSHIDKSEMILSKNLNLFFYHFCDASQINYDMTRKAYLKNKTTARFSYSSSENKLAKI